MCADLVMTVLDIAHCGSQICSQPSIFHENIEKRKQKFTPPCKIICSLSFYSICNNKASIFTKYCVKDYGLLYSEAAEFYGVSLTPGEGDRKVHE